MTYNVFSGTLNPTHFTSPPCGRLSYLDVSFWAHVNLHHWSWRQNMTELWQWKCGGVVCVSDAAVAELSVMNAVIDVAMTTSDHWHAVRVRPDHVVFPPRPPTLRACRNFRLSPSDLTNSYVVSGILYELRPSYGSEKRSCTFCYLLQWQMAPRFYVTPYISCYVHVSHGLVPSWRTVE